MSRGVFILEPVPPFRLDLTVWTLRRRPDNAVDRWDGTSYRRVLPLPAGPVEVAVTQTAPPEAARLEVAVTGQPNRAGVRAAVTAALERLLGLRIDLTDFYEFATHDRRLGPLAQRFRGMKPPRFATAFEGIVNAIACQQVTLTLGIRLLNRLAEEHGVAPEGERGAHAFPRPEDLAGLGTDDLRAIGFSRQKGRAMIDIARSIIEGRLDLEGLARVPDEEAVARLRGLRGVGRWTAEYVLLRGLGRTHVFPGDDVGGRNNLRRWLRLRKDLDYEGVQRTLARWRGYGGLIYFHLLLDRLEEAGYLQAEPCRPAGRDAGARGGESSGLSQGTSGKPSHSPNRRTASLSARPARNPTRRANSGVSMQHRNPSPPPTILTVGHSNRPLEEFLRLLQAHGATLVVDVRKMPGSRRNPQFGRDTLPQALRQAGIGYVHMPGLGGLRRRRPDSPNTGWENASFQGYADYMLTPEFQQSLEELLERADGERAVLMCAEAVPWRCHRSLIADALVVRGVAVEHLLGASRTQSHVRTPWARVQGALITYPPPAEDSGRDSPQSLVARPKKRGSRRHGP